MITICYGKEQEELELISFSETIEELNKRIESKTNNQKAGMIGELLFHLKSFEELKWIGYNNLDKKDKDML